jgi:hypothetical protein
MSQENVELVQGIYMQALDYTAYLDPEATAAAFASLRPLYDREYEFHAVVEGNRIVQHGLDGYLMFMRDWLAPWESYTITADEFRDLEPDKVAVLTRHRGRLKEGGTEVRTIGLDLWMLRSGRFLRLEAYLDRRAGLEAAGLRE